MVFDGAKSEHLDNLSKLKALDFKGAVLIEKPLFHENHDIDIATWVFGPCRGLAALGGQVSDLEISGNDVFSILTQTTDSRAVTVSLNRLDRVIHHEIIFNTAYKTLKADLIKRELGTDGAFTRFETHRDETYLGMHKDVLYMQQELACRFAQGLE